MNCPDVYIDGLFKRRYSTERSFQRLFKNSGVPCEIYLAYCVSRICVCRIVRYRDHRRIAPGARYVRYCDEQYAAGSTPENVYSVLCDFESSGAVLSCMQNKIGGVLFHSFNKPFSRADSMLFALLLPQRSIYTVAIEIHYGLVCTVCLHKGDYLQRV